MKRTFYTVFALFLLFSSAITAQDSLKLIDANLSGSAILNDASTSPEDMVLHSFLLNNDNQEKTFVWERTIVSLPDGWASAICDKNNCYLPFVDSREVNLPAGVNSNLDVHIYPAGSPGGDLNSVMPGEAEIHVRIYEKNNPSNEEMGTYYFTLYADASTGLTVIEQRDLKIFPNPATDRFQISENEVVTQVNIMNAIGQSVLLAPISNGNAIGVRKLRAGMYFVQMLDQKGEVVKTVRLMKN